jgi:hypothetical protein
MEEMEFHPITILRFLITVQYLVALVVGMGGCRV